ncbi:MAG: hypothetical protein U0360_05215 [Dehalococcoidia bacterium]
MRFFNRSRETAAPQALEAAAARPERRRGASHCANCTRLTRPLVYMENGRDYCLDCAVRCWIQLRFQPAGRRADDVTLAELLA